MIFPYICIRSSAILTNITENLFIKHNLSNFRRYPEEPVLLSVKKTSGEFMPVDHHVQRNGRIIKQEFPQSHSVDNLLRDHWKHSRKLIRHTDREIDYFENFLIEPVEAAAEDSGYGPESSVDDGDEDDRSQCYPETFRIKDKITLSKNITRTNSNKSYECFYSDLDSGAYSGSSTPENLNIPPFEHLSSPH